MSDAGPGAVPSPAGLRSAAGQPLELHGSELQQPKKFVPVVHSYHFPPAGHVPCDILSN